MAIVRRFFGGAVTQAIPTSLPYYYEATSQYRAFHDLLRAYYLSNGLYDEIRTALQVTGAEDESLKPLRNPASRAVEFYAAKLWPGTLPDALPIVTDNQAIIEPVKQIWTWSNWSHRKQVAARWLAMYGDLFIKVGSSEGKVFLQIIDPRHSPYYDLDDRGNLTHFRADIPISAIDAETGELTIESFTEVWDKGLQWYAQWTHTENFGVSLSQLGTPDYTADFSEFGVDFVPVVHVKHRDIGDDHGDGVFSHVIDKIDEANRQATRLHQMLYRSNRSLWVLQANLLDAQGRPMPAPTIGDSNELEIGDDTLFRLPGNSTLQSMVPQLNYTDALSILNAQLDEIERDLPELNYYRIKEMGGNISGRAIRLLLSDAVDNVLEVRGNAEAGLARADMMALTIGANMGLEGFNVGSYEAGDLEHSFAERAVIESEPDERADTLQKYRGAGLALTTAMRLTGFSEEEIVRAQTDLQMEQAQATTSLASALLEQQRRFDQEQQAQLGGPRQEPGTPEGLV